MSPLCEHVGSLFDDVDCHDNHSDGTYPLAHNPVTSLYVSGPVRFPVGLRLYRRYEELTQWEASVAKQVPDLLIPREKKARNRLHKQVDQVWLEDPEFRARHEQFRTKIALAIDLVEEAIRSKVPFGVVVFDAWYLAEDLVRVLVRRRKDWISLLKTNRLLETASFQLRDVNGWALKLPSPHIAVEELVPLIPAQAYRAVKVGEHTYWCFTLAVRIPGLGKVRIVVSFERESVTGRHVVLVTNRVDWSAAKIIGLYLQRWPTEIVQTHMTKGGGFPLGTGGHHVANLHLVVRDDDTINQQFYQLSALGKRQLVQGRLHLSAKRFESLGQNRDVHLLLRLCIQLTQLLRQAVLGLSHLRSFALELVAANDLGQIDFQQAGLLSFKLRERFPESLPAGLQGLGQPFTSVGTREFMGDQRGLAQDPAQILPDQRVQSPGRGKARRAAVAPCRPQGIGPAPTDRVGIAWWDGAPRTRQLTLATTDQAPEQVLMGRVIPASHLTIARQPGLGRRKGLLADDGRHGDGDPLLGRGRPMTVPRPHRAQGRLADARGHRTGALAIGRARIDRRAEDAAHRGDIPAWPSAWGRDLAVREALSDTIEGGRRLRRRYTTRTSG